MGLKDSLEWCSVNLIVVSKIYNCYHVEICWQTITVILLLSYYYYYYYYYKLYFRSLPKKGTRSIQSSALASSLKFVEYYHSRLVDTIVDINYLNC